MKYLKLFATAVIAVSCSAAHGQTADEVIRKHLTAIGGEENWKKITSTKLTGEMTAGGTKMPIAITTVKDKGYRLDMTMNGMANYVIVTPTGGWSYFPAQGQKEAEAMPAEAVKEEQDNLDPSMDPLVDYKAKGSIVTYLGKDDVEGTSCYKLKVALKGGKMQTVFVDETNNYIIRTVEKTKANGKEEESTSNFGNFQKLPEGIVFPMSIDSDGGPFAVKTVEINKVVDVTIFDPAASKK